MRLTVIIPTLNESQYLAATLWAVRKHAAIGEPHQIIVVDSGSTDETAIVALELGAQLVQNGCNMAGRAFALNKGAAHAAGDVFLFLDADTLPPQGYDSAIQTALIDPKTVGGAFEFALDGPEFGLRIVEIINRSRYKISQLYYGDQGIFVRASVFRSIGGYPLRGIFEASDFCAVMKRMGKLTLIRKPMKTSPRRFLEGGVYRVLANDIKLWWLNFMGKPVDQYSDGYWKENTRRGKGN